jgi:uncharacterized SAM-binding protein YcdF (DUF218 family)
MINHFVEFLIRPTFVLPVVIVAALVQLWRRRPDERRRLRWVVAPFLLLAVISTPAVSYLALWTVESAYPLQTELGERPEVIVVLSGYMTAPKADRSRAELGPDTYYRCLHTLTMYRQAGGCPILVSGGISEGAPDGPPLADAMVLFFRERGVKAADLIVENRSLTTHDNAVECSRLLRERGISRIVLITDAKHLGRASLCFQKEGIAVVPSACNAYTARYRNRLDDYLPSPHGAGHFLDAFHEWVGLAYYKLRGWI